MAEETAPFAFTEGEAPLLVSIPHAGTYVPDDIAARFTEAARPLPDTDWHVHRLYEFAAGTGASVLCATHSRYVIDLNRDPTGADLYPGADNTELVPATTFDRAPIYRSGMEPTAGEIEARRARLWQPYHDRLAAAVRTLVDRHGVAVLFDAHSIRSRVPRFFEGTLPDFNLGTASGRSADRHLADRVLAVLAAADGYTCVRDGRFTGGYITRRYGAPGEHVHAVQLELSQATYMEEAPPFRYLPDRADRLAPVLRAFVAAMLDWASAHAGLGQ